MLLRFPKVGWEPIYMPLVEASLYFLASTGVGYIRLLDGRYIPWARDAAWLCTTPVLLMQINGITTVKWRHWSLNTLQVKFLGSVWSPLACAHRRSKLLHSLPLTLRVQVVADLLMIVCGTTASYIPYDVLRWGLFSAGCLFYLFILYVTNRIFFGAIERFSSMGEKGQEVVSRLFVISRIFFFSWTLYPIFFLLSPQGLCAVGEKWIAVLHMMADLLAKNTFGIAWPTANQRVCFLDATATRASLTPHLSSWFLFCQEF